MVDPSTPEQPTPPEPSMEYDADTILPFFSSYNMSIVCIVVLVPLALWTLKSVCSLYKNVPNASLKTPAILIFLGPLVLQISNMVCLQMDSESTISLTTLFSKLYIVALFYSFYFLIREVVFFEHLLQSTEALNAEPAFTDGGSSSHSQISGGVFSLQPLTTPRGNRHTRHGSDLREQLMAVNYDRALEEEKIMNQVYPSMELQQIGSPVAKDDENKQQILNTEIFEIGKVSRCFGCASDEAFDSIEAADKFRQTTVRSFAFFGTVTLVKTLLEFFLTSFYVIDTNQETALLLPALDIFETLLTLYALYCTFMFCSCLAQGLIYEYQPVIKFTLISMMAIVVVCQDFVIYCFLGMFPPQGADSSQALSIAEQTKLSVYIASFFTSLEMIFLLILVSRHFKIRTTEEQDEDPDSYDELQGQPLHSHK